ncbi:MAG: HAMP domain-containing histidine kinase [Acidimicrobiia bacterium]|nr:HAMP domain-containing histidine kinase [Acidimicrobiia bacterium]
MAPADESRFRAAIQYLEVRRSFNTVRAFANGLMAAMGAYLWFGGAEAGPLLVSGALVIVIHAILARSRGTSALVPLVVDATVIGIISLFRGYTGAMQGAGLVYLVAGAVLLLPLRSAFVAVLYGMAWAIPMVLFGPLVELPPGAEWLDIASIFSSAAIVAQLLYATGRALHAAEERHHEALEAEKRAVELKDEFVSMVSHELRTPLTSIGGFADTLRENWANLPAKEVDEFLLIMRGEANHLSNLVEDILVIPRLEAGRLRLELKKIPLRNEAFEVARLVFAGTTRELQVDIPADISVVADPNRLRQIFRNLLENARKYGGDQVLITGEETGDSYKVVVADNGPGIPVEDRDRIFEHFEQAVKGDARSEGVGLGLPIARKLARAMGGDLWFEPRFPTGAQFLFTVEMSPSTSGGIVADLNETNVTPIRKTG